MTAAIVQVASGDRGPALGYVAASLHHGYSAIESLTERILRAFGQTSGAGERWHQELLAAAGYELSGARPRIFAPDTLAQLRGLLSFRHFFRHA